MYVLTACCLVCGSVDCLLRSTGVDRRRMGEDPGVEEGREGFFDVMKARRTTYSFQTSLGSTQ